MTKLTEPERLASMALFRGIDADDNQRLTLLEVRQLFEGDKAATQEFISFFEENEDGYVAITEWLRALRKMKINKSKKDLRDWLLKIEAQLKKDCKVEAILDGTHQPPPKAEAAAASAKKIKETR